MVHLNAHLPAPKGHGHDHHDGHGETHMITNPPCQHAFVVLGQENFFAVHMTQYHCEVHKYQLIFQFRLKNAAHRERLVELKETYPNDCFVLCNAEADPERGITLMAVPDLASGARPTFTGNIYQGMRPIEMEELTEPHFFPWSSKRCRPAIEEVEVEITRVVLFRPFSHADTRPDHPLMWIWGQDGEYHMTNIQTAERFSGIHDAPAWGPDFDSVISLKGTPDWVDPALLRAGIVASAADMDMYDPESWPKEELFPEGSMFRVLYRGEGDTNWLTAGPTLLNATFVCNSPEADPHKGTCLFISVMPEEYYE